MDFQINSVNRSWPFLNWNGTFNWPMIRWKWKLLTNNWIKMKTIHQKSDKNENYRPKFDPKWIFHHWIPFKSIELIALGRFNWNWIFSWPIIGWKWKLSTKNWPEMDFQINSVNRSWPFLNWNGTFNWPMIRWKWKLLTNNWIKMKTIHQKSDRKWKLSTKNWPEMDNWSTRSIAVFPFSNWNGTFNWPMIGWKWKLLTNNWIKMKITDQNLTQNGFFIIEFLSNQLNWSQWAILTEIGHSIDQ